VTYTRVCIDTIDSPDDENEAVRNIQFNSIYLFNLPCITHR